jgi:hypothetical protein
MFRSFVYPGARLTPEKASIPRELREPTVVILDHSGFRIIGLFSNNVVSFSRNVVLRGPVILSECGPKTADVFGPGDLCSLAATDSHRVCAQKSNQGYWLQHRVLGLARRR